MEAVVGGRSGAARPSRPAAPASGRPGCPAGSRRWTAGPSSWSGGRRRWRCRRRCVRCGSAGTRTRPPGTPRRRRSGQRPETRPAAPAGGWLSPREGGAGSPGRSGRFGRSGTHQALLPWRARGEWEGRAARGAPVTPRATGRRAAVGQGGAHGEGGRRRRGRWQRRGGREHPEGHGLTEGSASAGRLPRGTRTGPATPVRGGGVEHDDGHGEGPAARRTRPVPDVKRSPSSRSPPVRFAGRRRALPSRSRHARHAGVRADPGYLGAEL